MQAKLLPLLLGLSACGLAGPPDGGDLSERLAERVREAPFETVDFAELAPFEWTRFCAFHPYTTEEMAEEELGFDWPYMRWSGEKSNEGTNYLVFVSGETVVAAFDHPNNQGDFAGMEEPCHERDAARFTARTADHPRGHTITGNPVLIPVP
jgi:hypothetical protein